MGLFIRALVDGTDFRILRALLEDPFASNEAIGRKAGIRGTSVKARLDRLAAEIRFRGFHLVPAPECLGRVARGHFYRPDALTDARVEAAMRVDPVVWLVGHHDGIASVLTFEPQRDAPGRAALDEAMGGPPFLSVDVRLTLNPRPPVLSPLDWRVLRALLADARRPLVDAAAETGLSRRTVARHRDALLETGSAYVTPLWDEAKADAAVLYHLIAVGDGTLDRHALTRAAGPEALPYALLTQPPGYAFVSMATSTAHAIAAHARVAAVPGVTTALLNFPVRNEFAEGRVRGWIDEELRKWAAYSSER
jgi:DNA-binding Lrp family transcriptional regulator